MNKQQCKNCQNIFKGEYCFNCGQRNIGNRRLQMREVINDFFDNTFNLHKGFIFTFWKLIITPGNVAHAYINGKRKSFTNPTRYMVIALAFQTFIDYWFKTTDVIKNETYYRFPFLSNSLNDSMEIWNVKLAVEYILLTNLFMIILIPALVFIFFKKLKFNYAELLAVNFYFVPTILFITMPILFVTKVVFRVFVTKELVIFIFTFYMFWSNFSFFKMVSLIERVLRILAVIFVFMFIRILILPLVTSLIYPLS